MNCPLQARRCGGCTRLSVPYEKQLAHKRKTVSALFPSSPVLPVIGMKDPYHYRNKVIAAFAHDRTGLISGMYAYGTHYVLPTDDCLLENGHASHIVMTLRSILNRRRVQSYDENKKTGLVRFAQVRYAERTGQALVTIVTSKKEFPLAEQIAAELMEACPEVMGVIQNINPRPGSVVLGFQERTLAGSDTIKDVFLGRTVILSSRAFYQVNTAQAEVLYRKALEMTGIRKNDTVLDVYCGLGLIGLLAAEKAAQVTGIEINPDAVRQAEEIARLNHVPNISFRLGDAANELKKQTSSVILLDPPRAGLDQKTLEGVTALSPEKICYISCNPVTQARDVQVLAKAGYRIGAVQPVDMFPHTEHTECVVKLTRIGL